MLKTLTIFTWLFALASCSTTARDYAPVYMDGVRIMDTTEKSEYREYLSYYFDTLLNYRGFSGGILVAKNGQVLYEHYQGDVFGDGAVGIDATTPFHVASTSKTLTSTAVLQLLEKGRLALDDSLQLYFPAFPYKGVTLRHLLTHSSGIPNYAYFLPKLGWSTKRVVTNRDVLEVIEKRKPALEFSTGSRFKYCNTNFVLLALVVEQVSGLTFPQYVREYILEVAGMDDSYILSHDNQQDYMPSWTESGRKYNFEYLDGLYGDKNLFTTCRDLLKYDSAIRKNLLLQQETYDLAWEPNFRDGNRESREYYGLGWRLKLFPNNLKIPYHNGWWHGNNAVFQRLVADTAVVIVTGNRMNNRIYSTARIANLFRPYYYDSADHRYEYDSFMIRMQGDTFLRAKRR